MQSLPLKSLVLSETYNVRKTDREKGLDELKASIQAHGLLENLVVTQRGKKKPFEVVAGGRRLLALQALQKEGVLPDDCAVPCTVVDTGSAEEVSLAENSVRTPMHPADEFEAWAKLVADGMSVADIAARFGVSDTLVEKRLRLGRVAPMLMEAYRAEELSLETLMAYTLASDPKKQEALYERTKGSWEGNNPHSIRRMLTESAVSSRNKIATFVGLEAYEQAGGSVRRDLFSEDGECYFENSALLYELAGKQLEERAKALEGKWKWVESRIDLPYEERSKYSRIQPHPLSEVPEELLRKQEELATAFDALEYDYDDADQSEEADRLERELEEIQEKVDSKSGTS